MFFDQLDILVSYAQFIILIITLRGIFEALPPLLPSVFASLNLDISVVQKLISGQPAVDFRTYVAITILVALGIVLFGVLSQNALKVSMGFVFLLLSVDSLALGLLVFFSPTARAGLNVAAGSAVPLVALGAVGVGVSVVVAYFIAIDLGDPPKEEKRVTGEDIVAEIRNPLQRIEGMTEKLVPMEVAENALIGLVLLLTGLLLVRYVPGVDTTATGVYSVTFSTVQFALGLILIIVGGIISLLALASLSHALRVLKARVSIFFEDNVLKILLVIFSLLYIPIVSASVAIFNCNTFDCPAGSRQVDEGGELLGNVTSYCVPCITAPNQVCVLNASERLCAASRVLRLEMNQQIPCTDVQRLMWSGSVLVFVAVGLGVPYLLLRVISTTSEMIGTLIIASDDADDPTNVRFERTKSAQHIAVTRRATAAVNNDEDPEILWAKKLLSCKCASKFLFESFEYKYRYFPIVETTRRLLAVLFAKFIIRSLGSPDLVALIGETVLHTVTLVALIATRPYILDLEDAYSLGLTAIIIVVAAVMLAFATGANITSTALVGIIIAALSIAGVLLVVSMVTSFLRYRQQQREAEESVQAFIDMLEKKHRQLARSMSLAATLPRLQEPPSPPQAPLSARKRGEGKEARAEDSPPLTSPKRRGKKVTVSFNPEQGNVVTRALIRLQSNVRSSRRIAEASVRQSQLGTQLQNASTDRRINVAVSSIVNRWLFVVGLLLAVAATVSVLGLFIRDNAATFSSHDTAEESPYGLLPGALGGFSTWDAFVENCCCTAAIVPMEGEAGRNATLRAMEWAAESMGVTIGELSEVAVTAGSTRKSIALAESWVCSSGRVRERVRMRYVVFRNGSIDFVSGLSVRGLCRPTFAAGCSLRVHDIVGSDRQVILPHCVNTTDETILRLW